MPDCGAKALETHAQSRDLAAIGPETNANTPDILMCNANHRLACGLTNKGLKTGAFRDQFGRFRFSIGRLRDRFGHFRGPIVRNRAQSGAIGQFRAKGQIMGYHPRHQMDLPISKEVYDALLAAAFDTTVFNGRNFHCMVEGDHIYYAGAQVSPSGFVNAVGGTRRSASKSLWILFPKSASWRLAQAMRPKRAVRRARAAPSCA